MEVQVFGVKKSANTRKALRFFAERRIKPHFVDLLERAASPGELRRFVQKFGLTALIDTESRAYRDRGLQHSRLSDDRWIEVLVEDPLILRMPLVRHRHELTIGDGESEWKRWVAQDRA